jgi:hypothetical protein
MLAYVPELRNAISNADAACMGHGYYSVFVA